MKKTFYMLGAALTAATLHTQAQTQKGNFTIGAAFGTPGNFTAASSPVDKSFQMSLQPSFGYFVANKFEVGALLNAGLRSSSSNYVSEVKSRRTNLGLGLYARYYFGKSATLKPYLIAGAGYDRYWNYYNTGGSVNRYAYGDAYAFGGAGLAWFIRPNIAFTSELRYTRFVERYPRGLLTGNFGFQIFLGKRK
jgi:outer membrane protein W